ncbi:hypothetical protein SteCoe_13349 [Stentor coeruleus]|uniref:RING-type domain-containing protein n=1 Tax=Stentor coeruleus TaxID=5963 RepID=A0A1R2C8N9_9CILI|nr:hypothetical protein SteCoe_13349 [Stentor coeruleus]
MNRSSRRSTVNTNFPKLRKTATSTSGIPINKIYSTMDLRQPTSDEIFVREIEKKIEEQRIDLEERNVAIKSLLGHFENIASVCRDEKNKNIEFRTQNMELVKENRQLKRIIEEKNAATERNCYSRVSKSPLLVNKDEIDVILKENDSLKEVIKLKDKEIEEKTSEISSFTYKVMNYREINSGMEKSINDLNVEINMNKNIKRKLEEEISSLHGQNQVLNEKIQGFLSRIEDLEREIKKNKLEYDELMKNTEIKDREIAKMRTLNNKLCSENQKITENMAKEKTKEKKELVEYKNNSELIEAYIKELSAANEKIDRLEKKKIEKFHRIKKELVASLEEFKKNSQSDILKYEKIIQDLELDKKTKDSKIKALTDELSRSETQKNSYLSDLNKTEIALTNEKHSLSTLSTKHNEIISETQKLKSQLESLNQTLERQSKKLIKLHNYKLKLKTIEKDQKTTSSANSKLEKSLDHLNEKYKSDKEKWSNEENSLLTKIQSLQEELNSEKTFNSIHLQEVLKLKLALSSQESKIIRAQKTEEDNKFKAIISKLEIEITENRETISKLQKNLMNNSSQLADKIKIIEGLEKTIYELKETIEKQKAELKSPDFLGLVEKSRILKDREQAITSELAKISYAVEAFENGLSCYVCLGCLESPVIIIPCGHAVCYKCTTNDSNACPQCSRKLHGQYKIDWLEHLADKISFQKQVLESVNALMANRFYCELYNKLQ